MKHEQELRNLDTQCALLYRDADYEKCVEVARSSYKLRSSLLGVDHRDSILNLANLGASLGRAGYLKEAEQAFREVLENRYKHGGQANYLEMTTAMMHLGVCLKNQGKFVESEQLLHDSLMKSLEGPNGGIDSLATAEASFASAVLAIQMGRICKAHFLFYIAEIGLKRSLGVEHQHTIDTGWWTKRSFELMTDEGKIPVLKEMSDLMDQIATIKGNEALRRSQMELVNTWDGAEFDSKAAWKSESNCDVCGFAYTLTERQHHCRLCAQSVCDACSLSSVFMGAVKPSKVRACNVCANSGFA